VVPVYFRVSGTTAGAELDPPEARESGSARRRRAGSPTGRRTEDGGYADFGVVVQLSIAQTEQITARDTGGLR
jgi:hypothetical protein